MTKSTTSHPKRRHHRRTSPFPSLSGWWMILLVTLCCGCCLLSPPSVHAKEIEATKDWALLGENDTVAAGMHVRMDLSTGEKWVKLPDDDDDDGKAPGDKASSISSSNAVAIDAQGGVTEMIHSELNNNDGNPQKQAEAAAEEPNYDYEMMHRTLSNLPPEEQERIGGIPKLPDAALTKLTPEQRVAFETRMKEIWEQRQAELKAFQEDHLADLPQLLKDRIASIKTYLEQPMAGLQELEVVAAEAKDKDKDEEEEYVGDIVAVLQDLEYQLSDVDMARDFYTLGGWPLLSSLLADATHESNNIQNTTSADQQQTLSDDDWNKVNLIQAHAAWAIGTAVKNTGEFSPHAIEQVEVPHANNQIVKTTTLDLVLAQFVASSTAVLEYDTTQQAQQSDENNNNDYFDTVMMKVHKTLYALGALLRGNRQAQTHFCADQGPSLLANVLATVADQAHDNGNKLPKDKMKIAQRLLSLAQDIVMDVTLHSSTSEQVDEAIGKAFSNAQWCNTVLKFLPVPRLYETSLLTIQQLAPQCAIHWDSATALQSVKDPPPQVQQVWLPKDLDEDIRKERMELLQATIGAIENMQ